MKTGTCFLTHPLKPRLLTCLSILITKHCYLPSRRYLPELQERAVCTLYNTFASCTNNYDLNYEKKNLSCCLEGKSIFVRKMKSPAKLTLETKWFSMPCSSSCSAFSVMLTLQVDMTTFHTKVTTEADEVASLSHFMPEADRAASQAKLLQKVSRDTSQTKVTRWSNLPNISLLHHRLLPPGLSRSLLCLSFCHCGKNMCPGQSQDSLWTFYSGVQDRLVMP